MLDFGTGVGGGGVIEELFLVVFRRKDRVSNMVIIVIDLFLIYFYNNFKFVY